MNVKIEWADRAKGIGILLVVFGHVLRGLNNAGIFEGMIFYYLDYMIYTFHMPLFFFISGMFFLKSFTDKGLKKFIKVKFSYLFYLYLVWSIILFFVQLMLNNYTNGTTQLEGILNIFTTPKGIMWFIYALLAIFIVNAFVFSLFPKNNYIYAVIILIIAGIIFRGFNIIDIYIIDKILKNFLFFELGILLSITKYKYKFTHPLAILSLFGFLFITTLYLNLFKYSINFDNQIMSTFAGVMVVCILAQNIKSTFFEYIGTISLEVYLLHVLFASGIRIILHKFLNIDSLIIHIFIGLLLGLLGPILIVEIRKKITIINFLFKSPLKF